MTRGHDEAGPPVRGPYWQGPDEDGAPWDDDAPPSAPSSPEPAWGGASNVDAWASDPSPMPPADAPPPAPPNPWSTPTRAPVPDGARPLWAVVKPRTLALVVGALFALVFVGGRVGSFSTSNDSDPSDAAGITLDLPDIEEPDVTLGNPGVQIGDHWHAALGVYVCDHWLDDGTGPGLWQWPTATPQGSPGRSATSQYAGLHSHGDGLIHLEPVTADEVGKNATLGQYFRFGGWQLSGGYLTFLGTTAYSGIPCAGRAGLWEWSVNGERKYSNPADYVLADGDEIVLAFVPDGVPFEAIGRPPSASNLVSDTTAL